MIMVVVGLVVVDEVMVVVLVTGLVEEEQEPFVGSGAARSSY
jgi:hypothetical protein